MSVLDLQLRRRFRVHIQTLLKEPVLASSLVTFNPDRLDGLHIAEELCAYKRIIAMVQNREGATGSIHAHVFTKELEPAIFVASHSGLCAHAHEPWMVPEDHHNKIVAHIQGLDLK